MIATLRQALILILLLSLSACGRGSAFQNSMIVSDAVKREKFIEPTEPLTLSNPYSKAEYSVYNFVSATFATDAKGESLSARVTIESSAGTEIVELVGIVRPDGSVSLLDLSPARDGKNRLVGEGLCVDVGVCQKVILNVYFNVAGKTLKKQFSSDSLKQKPVVAKPVNPPPKSKDDLVDETNGADEELGDFVGPARNENLIGQLYKRSNTPQIPEKPTLPTPPTSTPPTGPLPVKPQPEPITPLPSKPLPKPVAKPVTARPPISKPAPVVAKTPATKPVAQPISKPAAKPAAQTPTKKPVENSDANSGANSGAASKALAYPFPPSTPAPNEDDVDLKFVHLEAKLAPMMNLRDGGVSRGSYGYSLNPKSGITDANSLPSNISGLVPINVTAGAHWGSGMLVSFLQNAATYLFKTMGLSIYVGDMSLKSGGGYGASSSHNTHRNGLDADIAYLGLAHPLRDSSLDARGHVVSGFDFEKTWTFLKLAFHQEIVQDSGGDALPTTAISRIYMSHRVKDGFCAWAKENARQDSRETVELLRLIRREKNHHNIFI